MSNLRVRLSTLALLASAAQAAPVLERVETPPAGIVPLVSVTHGRVQETAGGWKYQWPGTYAESAFRGNEVFLRVGSEPSLLHVILDGVEITKLVRPAAGLYRVGGLMQGRHVLRVESASENQGGPITFGGFAARAPVKAAKLPTRKRQIEFIGDSHSVGYGNISTKRQCTPDEIWETTDTSQAFGPLTAKHFDADYQVNAISGRGIVRNYNGFIADPLPVAYPFTLFDKATRYEDPRWAPQVVVISLGTNDFTTPLNPGEPWSSRDALHTDFESTYLAFLEDLRARRPGALLIVGASDMAEGEIDAEARKVVERLSSQGDSNVVYAPVGALTLTSCDWHPSLEDHLNISKALIGIIDARKPNW